MKKEITRIDAQGFQTTVFLHDANGQPDSLLRDFSVCDTHTQQYCPSGDRIVLEAGEENKNWQSVEKILNASFEKKLSRDSVMLGLGGGVICDMTAFASNLYLRGCRLVLVPTTLLAMVDASIGGKTGIDWNQYKNMVGTFYPASEIHIFPSVLKTLDQRQFLCGMGEVFKHGMLDSTDIWDFLEDNLEKILARDTDILSVLIARNAAFKASVVNADLRESGIRAHLNLGHTFGHALESVTGFADFSHGEGVAWGLNAALKTGLKLGITSESWARRVMALLQKTGYRLTAPGTSPQALLQAMQVDKKRKGGKVRYILQKDRGETFITEVDDGLILSVLSECCS